MCPDPFVLCPYCGEASDETVAVCVKCECRLPATPEPNWENALLRLLMGFFTIFGLMHVMHVVHVATPHF